MAEQVWGASIYVKAYKIYQSHIFKKLFFFPPGFIFRYKAPKKDNQKRFGIYEFYYSKQANAAIYKYSNDYFFMLVWGERTSASQGWSDCSWSGLVSLQCPVLVSSPVLVHVCSSVWSRTQSCMHVHISGTLLTDHQIQKTLKILEFIKDTTRWNSKYRQNIWEVETILLSQTINCVLKEDCLSHAHIITTYHVLHCCIIQKHVSLVKTP